MYIFKNNIVNFLLIFIWMTAFQIVFSQVASAIEAEKPKVAIKKAIIMNSVSVSAQKNLSLDKLLAEMEASFLAARKFDMVTRNKGTLDAIREEQKFAESQLAAGNAAQSGMLQNADYLIIPEVHIFEFSTSSKKVPNLQNKYFRADHGTLEINAQVLDTESGQIKSTFYLKDSFSTKEQMVSSQGGVPSDEHFTKMAKAVSAQMVDQFLGLVFPVEIINVKGSQVYLNRGEDGGYKKGTVLDVYSKGEVLIDPHTGDDLGSAEEFVGKIEVTKVNPKFTVAKILPDGLEGDVTVGCIIRKP